MTDEERREFLAIRKEAGRLIDPAVAEVDWDYRYDQDPYGIYDDLLEEEKQVGRNYFARSPGGVWVAFRDLPQATREALSSSRMPSFVVGGTPAD